MGKVLEKIPLEMLPSLLIPAIEAYFLDMKLPGELVAKMPLRAHSHVLPIDLYHEVEISLRRATRQSEHGLILFDIDWEVRDNSPMPHFSGTLSQWTPQHPEGTFLVLEGKYTAPLGQPGKVFDATIGQWIASLTASDLLNRLAAHLKDKADEAVSLPKT